MLSLIAIVYIIFAMPPPPMIASHFQHFALLFPIFASFRFIFFHYATPFSIFSFRRRCFRRHFTQPHFLLFIFSLGHSRY
jgi:hypothetical protein